ncbi:hypothetical protein [Nocardia fluminea]|uniref:hypothetical protein n=1 Tax=Nocardia fluminea TaxID=134984 RepID=UPI0033C2D2A8
MSFVESVVTNLVANIAFWLLLGAAFLVGGRQVERRMVRFFAMHRSRRIDVYLSNTALPRPDGRPRYSLSLHEFHAAQAVDKLVGAAPLRLPELVRGLVDGIWLRRRISSRVAVSQAANGAELTDSCIVVGSGARNLLRRFAVMEGIARATIVRELSTDLASHAVGEEVEVAITVGDGGQQSIKAVKNIAVIEKSTRPDGGAAAFYCLGVRADTSWVAVEYLVRNWRRLAKQFKDEDFIIVLGSAWEADYFADYPEPTLLAAVRVPRS